MPPEITGASQGDTQRELNASGESLERLRTRARAAATITAALAAALAAGIVLSATPLFPGYAQAVGTMAVVCFFAATAIFTSASLVNVQEKSIASDLWRSLLAVVVSWEVRLKPGEVSSPKAPSSIRLSQERAFSRIDTIIRVATAITAVGFIFLIVCAIQMAWKSDVHVEVFSTNEVLVESCPDAGGSVRGWVDGASLYRDSGVVALEIAEGQCDPSLGKLVYIDRADLLLVKMVE